MKLSFYNYDIATPALAYPATVLTKDNPVAVAVNTISNLVPAATLMFKPVTDPVRMVPILINPVKAGLKLMLVAAIGVNTLLGVVDWYN